MTLQTLRPRAMGEVVDRAVDAWREHRWTLLRLMLPVQLSLYAAMKLFTALMETTREGSENAGVGMLLRLLAALTAFLVVCVLALLASVFQACVGAHVVGQSLHGAPVPLKDAYRAMRRRVGPLLLSGLVLLLLSIGVSIISATVTFIVIGGVGIVIASTRAALGFAFAGSTVVGAVAWLLWLWLRGFVWVPVVALEHGSGSDVLARIRTLLRGRSSSGFASNIRLRTAVVLTVVGIIAQAGTVAAGLPSYVVTGYYAWKERAGEGDGIGLSAPAHLIIPLELLATVSGTFVTTLWITSSVLYYLDLRVRKEGIDLQMRLGALENASRARPTPFEPSPGFAES